MKLAKWLVLAVSLGVWSGAHAADEIPGATPVSPTDYTTTNVQEAGVDEPDLVDTDGDYIYVAEGTELHIIDSWPAEETELVATVNLGAWVRGLFAWNNVVVALVREWWGGNRITFVDVFNRSYPAITRQIDLLGQLVDAHLVRDHLYVVMNRNPNFSTMSVVSIDLNDGDVNATGILADGWHVYGSRDGLYVAESSSRWQDPEGAATNIHKFVLNDGDPQYVASGKVPGWVLNQWAMSEFERVSRVATTSAPTLWRDADPDANSVFALQQRGTELQIAGQARGLAPGEQMFGVRFTGDVGYVSFSRSLVTVDLSDPQDPGALGELRTPGFSTYLHPVEAGLLVGIGRSGDDSGAAAGLALQLFDVSDPSSPTRIHQRVIGTGDGWSYSEAEWDHHAFTYSGDVLSLPIYTYDYDASTGEWKGFSELIVFEAARDGGFTEVGRVSHSRLVDDSSCSYCRIRRSIHIEDYLFTVSNVGVTASLLRAPDAEIARVVFPRDGRL